MDDWEPKGFRHLYFPLIAVALVGAVVGWVSSGAGLDLSETRAQLIESSIRSTGGGPHSIVEALANKLMLPAIPCALYAGHLLWQFGIKEGRLPILKLPYVSMPIAVFLFQAFTSGGRRPILTGLQCYAIGFALNVVNVRFERRKAFYRWIGIAIVTVLCFIMFTSFVRQQRSKMWHGIYSSEWDDYPWLKPLSGAIEYLADPFVGYQYKRHYYQNQDLMHGAVTFQGLHGLSVPFVSRLSGSEWSVGSLFGMPNVLKGEGFFMDIPNASTVASCFLGLYRDFGTIGIYIASAILVLASHGAFVVWLIRPARGFIGMFPIFIANMFWLNSTFSSILGDGDAAGYVMTFLICDAFCYAVVRYETGIAKTSMRAKRRRVA